jgi:ribosomal protein S7
MVQKKLKNKGIYFKLLGYLVKTGKKTVIKSEIDKAFFLLSVQLKKSIFLIFVRLFLKLNTFIEVKKIRVRRNSFFVPFSITFKRRLYLIVKWLVEAVSENKRKISFSNKLLTELLSLFKSKVSISLLKKTKNNSLCLKNKTNVHYRW